MKIVTRNVVLMGLMISAAFFLPSSAAGTCDLNQCRDQAYQQRETAEYNCVLTYGYTHDTDVCVTGVTNTYYAQMDWCQNNCS